MVRAKMGIVRGDVRAGWGEPGGE